MTGILLTLAAPQGAQLVPAAVPVSLTSLKDRPEPEAGLLRPGDQCYDEYRECVDRVSKRGYALFPLLARRISR